MPFNDVTTRMMSRKTSFTGQFNMHCRLLCLQVLLSSRYTVHTCTLSWAIIMTSHRNDVIVRESLSKPASCKCVISNDYKLTYALLRSYCLYVSFLSCPPSVLFIAGDSFHGKPLALRNSVRAYVLDANTIKILCLCSALLAVRMCKALIQPLLLNSRQLKERIDNLFFFFKTQATTSIRDFPEISVNRCGLCAVTNSGDRWLMVYCRQGNAINLHSMCA